METENTTSMGINIFPNPASQQLNVHSTENINYISIYNAMGEKVLFIANVHEMASVIDVSFLNKGIYSAVINTDKGNAIKNWFCNNQLF